MTSPGVGGMASGALDSSARSRAVFRSDVRASAPMMTFSVTVRSRKGFGVGGEYAFTNFVTGFIEYNYYDFGNRDLTFVQNNGQTFIYGIDETKHVVKAGLNFRFGGYGYRGY